LCREPGVTRYQHSTTEVTEGAQAWWQAGAGFSFGLDLDLFLCSPHMKPFPVAWDAPAVYCPHSLRPASGTMRIAHSRKPHPWVHQAPQWWCGLTKTWGPAFLTDSSVSKDSIALVLWGVCEEKMVCTVPKGESHNNLYPSVFPATLRCPSRASHSACSALSEAQW
jgi:hypothetical protein